MTREGQLAKEFVLSFYDDARFVWRKDMGSLVRDVMSNQCQIVTGDKEKSISKSWTYNENDAWIDAKNLVYQTMLRKLEQ